MIIWVSIPMLLAIRLVLVALGVALIYYWYKGRLSAIAGILLISICAAGIWGVSSEISRIHRQDIGTSHERPLDKDASTSMREKQ